MTLATHHEEGEPPIERKHLRGTWAMEQEAALISTRERLYNALARFEQEKLFGLEAAESVNDHLLTLFSRTPGSAGYTGTFINAPFLEDMRELGGQDVVIVGVPLDTGCTGRPGTRFGPEALRRMSQLGSAYSSNRGVMLHESLNIVDAGDIQVIPADLEKSFDQITQAISYIVQRGVFPVVLGGDHSIGYPDLRGLAPHVDGSIGIIHFDRHNDLSEYTLDARMHSTTFLHATDIPNVSASNLVQIGIGGWTGSKPGMRVARERQVTIMTMEDIDHYGIERVMEYALEVAWKNARAVWLSFDIDVVDPAFAPGTGTPEPGGLQPREVFCMLQLAAREGLAGMELVEISPPYDVADITALLGSRIVMYLLAALVEAGKLGKSLRAS